jgi:hypothetical protein
MGRRYQNIVGGMTFPYMLRELLNPMNWYREFKYDHQRMTRGWCDRDTWDTGRHLLYITSGMLRQLANDKRHVTDWPAYFKMNYNNNRGYTDLKEVADDIDAYLNFDDAAWGDSLGFEIKHDYVEREHSIEMVPANTEDENRRIRRAIQLSHEEEKRLYEKAKNAMFFVALNFPGLWD